MLLYFEASPKKEKKKKTENNEEKIQLKRPNQLELIQGDNQRKHFAHKIFNTGFSLFLSG